MQWRVIQSLLCELWALKSTWWVELGDPGAALGKLGTGRRAEMGAVGRVAVRIARGWGSGSDARHRIRGLRVLAAAAVTEEHPVLWAAQLGRNPHAVDHALVCVGRIRAPRVAHELR